MGTNSGGYGEGAMWPPSPNEFCRRLYQGSHVLTIQRTSCKTRHSAARPNDDRKKEGVSSEPTSYGFRPDTILLCSPGKTKIHLQQMVRSFNVLPGHFAAWLSLVNSCLAATAPSIQALSTRIVAVPYPSNLTTLGVILDLAAPQ